MQRTACSKMAQAILLNNWKMPGEHQEFGRFLSAFQKLGSKARPGSLEVLRLPRNVDAIFPVD
jgi:hypothetical protein